jgi:hypothetical protein
LSEAATTRLRIQRVRRGVRQGARCVAGRPTSGRARRCTRAVTVRTLIRRARAGPNALPFGGFVRGRPLVAGAYRVTAQATDAALNVSREQRSAFTIVRR